MPNWIPGIDISRHQGDVDVKTVITEGKMRYIIIKATEGGDFRDPRFNSNWRKLLTYDPAGGAQLSVYRGVYHFARQDLNKGPKGAEKEAMNLCKTVKGARRFRKGCLPPALDWEKYAGTPKSNVEWIDTFLNVCENELGRTPMIYTGVNVWKHTTGDSDEFVDRCKLWEVKYLRNASEPPRVPKDKKKKEWKWTLWQWSGGGEWAYGPKCPGVKSGGGVVDLNRFNGDEKALAKLAGM